MTEQTDAPPSEAETDDGWYWAIVLVMGHRRHVGRTREVERFGIKMVRVDVPTKGDPEAHGWTTHFYTGTSLFGFTPCTREAAFAANKPYEPPARLALSARYAADDGDDDGMPF